jgi:ParB family chromosome partitioning protein
MATKEKTGETETAVALAIPIGRVCPDPRNRKVEDDDELKNLADSIAVLGLLQPVHVKQLPSGEYELVDGERRWRAAQKVGLDKIMAFVVAGESNESGALIGLALNEHREAAGCLYVARRLREIKNELGLTHDEVAARTGMPLDRVKTYSSLFAASDSLLTFFEERNIALKVAAEFVRFEKASNEARTRRLVARYREHPLSREQIIALRKREQGKEGAKQEARARASSPARVRVGFTARLEAAFACDAEGAKKELEAALGRLGFRLVPAEPAPGCPGNSERPVGGTVA